MPSHYWGDEWFEKNGDDLYRAINYCTERWYKYGRIGTTFSKEKYGTFRHNTTPYYGSWPIHELINPGYVYYQWPKWLLPWEMKLGKVVQFLRLDRVVRWYQSIVFNYTIQTAVKKWPHIAYELLVDTDQWEWIRPGIFGPLDGKKLHSQYWVTVGGDNDQN